jgi:hypothetical protein
MAATPKQKPENELPPEIEKIKNTLKSIIFISRVT